MLGADGQGFDIMMGVVLPVFAVLSAACSNGLMAGAVRRTVEHAAGTRHADTGATLADLPTIRSYIARMRVKTDMSSALAQRHFTAIAEQASGRNAPRPRVQGSGRRDCKRGSRSGNASVRRGRVSAKMSAVERFFRDARAAGVMAPTTDVLYDFIGKAVCGMPLF